MAEQKAKYPKGKHPNSLANLKSQWKPGQSGNPKGRSKRIQYISEALRELLKNPDDARQIAERIIKDAKAGNYNAINFLADRTEGKVTQPIGGDPNMPIVVEKIVAHVTEDKNGSDSSKGS